MRRRLPISNSASSYLLERLEASTDRSAPPSLDLGRVEEGLLDIQRSLERQHANLVSLADTSRSGGSAPAMDSGIVDAVKRELSDIRYSQSETDRRTQDSLETVHNTLGHVVDRLAMIEGDLRAVRAAPVAAQPMAPPAPAVTMREEAPRAAMPQPSSAPMPYTQAPHAEAGTAESRGPCRKPSPPRRANSMPPQPVAPPMPPRAISEILEPHAAAPRAAIAPDLPPDHPLEPGTRPAARMSSPSERIAASESVINEIAAGTERTRQFVELHRRRAPRRAGCGRRSRQ